MPIRVACIGAGFIAARHLSNLSAMPGVEVAGVADVELERAVEFSDRYGGRPYGNWRDLLEVEQPQCTYVCVPPFAHGEPEEALCAAGIPFFVEKPLGVDAEGPERIANLVTQGDLITSVGYHWRYLDTVERAAALVAQNPPRLAMGYWFDLVPPPRWWVQRERSGGQIVEQTTHIFDLARCLLGEVERVFGAACSLPLNRFPEGDIEPVSVATLQFASGALGVIASTCVLHYPYRIGLWLYGEDMIVECRELSLRVETPEGGETAEPRVDPFRREDEAFITAVRTGDRSSIRVPYAEALQTHRLVMRVVQSAEMSQALPLPVAAEARGNS